MFDPWRNIGITYTEEDHFSILVTSELRHRSAVHKAISDLITFGVDTAYTDPQIRSALDDLFSTYGGEWGVYVLVGATAIIDAIANDTTMPWLDLDAGGQTLRSRLIDRLTNV